MDLAKLIPLLIQVSIGLAVFALGLQVDIRDLTYLWRRPGLLVRSLLSMNVVMPLVAAALAAALRLPPSVEIVLVALALSPVPPTLPKKGIKTGNLSYAFSLQVTEAVLAIVFIPIGVELFELAFGLPLQMSPVAVAQVVLISVLAPLAAGMLVRRLALSLAGRIARPVSLVGTVLLVVSILPVLITAVPDAMQLIGSGTLATIAAFVVAGLVAGHLLGGPAQEDRTVLALNTASRHPGVATAIAAASFPGQELVLEAVLLYLIVNAVVSIPYLAWRRRQAGKANEVKHGGTINGKGQ